MVALWICCFPFSDNITASTGSHCVAGVSGTWLLTNRNRIGFCLGALGCCAGFGAALLSGQFGFVVYNVILIAMMTRGFIRWGGNNMQAAE